MQIIQKNAHAVLFERATHLGQEPHNSWRCIYINLSSYRLRQNRPLLMHFFGKAVSQLLTEAEGHIFMCRDGDIFILFQGQAKPLIDKLGEHFEGMQLGDDGQPKDPMYTILDLGRDWNVFYHLCLSKSRQLAPFWEQPAPAKHSDYVN